LFKEEFADGEEESATLHRTANLRGAFALEQTAQDKRKIDPHICSDFVTNSKRVYAVDISQPDSPFHQR